MDVKSTGISAKLDDRDVREAIVDFMDKHGYEINECDISFTMGRKPKALSCSIETGVSGNSEERQESPVKEVPEAKVQEESPQESFDDATSESSTQGSIFDTAVQEDPMMAAADPDLDTSSDTQETTSIFG